MSRPLPESKLSLQYRLLIHKSNKAMRNVTKKVCFALLVVVAALVLAGCKSSKHVEQTTVVDRVGRQVFAADTLSRKAQSEKTDSFRLSVVRLDSVVESVQDSVRETITLDANGKVVKRDVWHQTNRNRDHYHFADRGQSARSTSNNRDSTYRASALVAKKDSTLLRDSAKITEIPRPDVGTTVAKKAAGGVKAAATKARNFVRDLIVGLAIFIILIVAIYFLLRWKFGIDVLDLFKKK